MSSSAYALDLQFAFDVVMTALRLENSYSFILPPRCLVQASHASILTTELTSLFPTKKSRYLPGTVWLPRPPLARALHKNGLRWSSELIRVSGELWDFPPVLVGNSEVSNSGN